MRTCTVLVPSSTTRLKFIALPFGSDRDRQRDAHEWIEWHRSGFAPGRED